MWNSEICEICGKEFKELLKEDKENDISWYGLQVNKNICKKCAKPIRHELRMESSKTHKEGCCCHSCIIAIENGYFKRNNEWIKRPNVICKSAQIGCETCDHSKEHILSENGYCNYECNCNRTIGCEDVE